MLVIRFCFTIDQIKTSFFIPIVFLDLRTTYKHIIVRFIQIPECTITRMYIARLSSSVRTMSTKVAVVLSGCGVYDGTEVHESSAVLTHLSRHGAQAACFAPDKVSSDFVKIYYRFFQIILPPNHFITSLSLNYINDLYLQI